MIVGALWLILTVFELIAILEVIHRISDWGKPWKERKLIWFVFNLFLLALSPLAYVCVNFYVVEHLTGRRGIDYKNKDTWLTIAALTMNAFSYLIFVWITKKNYDWLQFTKTTASDLIRSGSLSIIFMNSVFILSGLSFYALVAYPRLRAEYGGGKKQKIVLVSKLDQIPTFTLLGFGIGDDGRKVEPVELIFEASDFIIVTLPKSIDPKSGIRSIRIKKDMADAVFYISNE